MYLLYQELVLYQSKGTDPRSIQLCPQCQRRGVFFSAMDNKVTTYIKMFHKYPNYAHITLESHIFQHLMFTLALLDIH